MPNNHQQNNYYNPYNHNPANQQQPPVYYQPNPYGVPPYQPNPYIEAQQKIMRMKKAERSEIYKVGFILGIAIIAYLIGQVIVSAFLQTTGLMKLYETSTIFQSCFTAVGISFFSMAVPFFIMSRILKKNYVSPLVPAKKNSTSINLAWIGFGLGACYVAQFAVVFVIQIFKQMGYELTQPETNDPNTILACLIQFMAIAIIPPIFEEFSLRCCAMGALRKYGKGFAVFISSIVFGLMHMNVIQFVFAFLVGMVLGFITIKTDNIIPAIIVHALNNGISVINTIVKVAANEKVANLVYIIIVIIWIAVGIIGTVALVTKKQFNMEKAFKNPASNSFAVKVLCTLPGLFVPFVLMIYITSKSVVPV